MKKYFVTLNYDVKVTEEQANDYVREYFNAINIGGVITEDYHGNKKFHHHFLVGEADLPIKEWNYGEVEIVPTSDVDWKD